MLPLVVVTVPSADVVSLVVLVVFEPSEFVVVVVVVRVVEPSALLVVVVTALLLVDGVDVPDSPAHIGVPSASVPTLRVPAGHPVEASPVGGGDGGELGTLASPAVAAPANEPTV